MQYRYDFIISSVRFAVMCDESLNVQDRFLPFRAEIIEKGSLPEYDIAIEVLFDEFVIDSSYQKVSAGVFKKDEKLYTLHNIPDNKLVIREENAACGGDVKLHIPLSYKDYFCHCGRWLNFLSLERMLISYGRILIHASGVIYNDKAVIFSAPSGVGKSTQARLWNEHFGSEIINGDKLILGFDENGRLMAYGSPTAGTSGIIKNVCAEVGAVLMLEQSPENRIERLEKRHSLLKLYSEAVKSVYDEEYNSAILTFILKVVDHTGIYRFRCLPDISAVKYISDYLKKGQEI